MNPTNAQMIDYLNYYTDRSKEQAGAACHAGRQGTKSDQYRHLDPSAASHSINP